MTPEQKRSYLRLLGRTWLPVLLLVTIFIVVLMVVSRQMRLWVLGRYHRVKFGPLEDLWWKHKGARDSKDPTAEENDTP